MPLDVGAFALSRATARSWPSPSRSSSTAPTLACTVDRRRRRREAQGHRPALRLAASSATGTPGRTAGARTSSSCPWPPTAPRPRRRRDEGHGRRRAVEAVRRRRGVHLHAGRPRHRVHRPRRGPRGGLVDEPRPLGRADRRQRQAAQPDRRQQGHRHRPGVLARRQDARVSVDGARRLRGRQAARRCCDRRGRRAPRAMLDGSVGSLAERARLVAPTARRSTPPPQDVGQQSLFAIDVGDAARRNRCSAEGHGQRRRRA